MIMKKKIKTVLCLALFALSLTSRPVNGMYYGGEGDLRFFLDYWTWIQDENGNWDIGRVTHCDNPGSNCIIGPTIVGPCDK